MHLIIVTDIFGVTAAVSTLAQSLQSLPVQVSVLDPYAGQDPLLANENIAYDYFLAQCGHDAYVEKLQHMMRSASAPIFLLGFSAGASACWRSIASRWPNKVVHCIGFYPGQIRHYLHLRPQYPCTIIWPAHEHHFSVAEVSTQLAQLPHVHCMHTEFLHGFMNPSSESFSAPAAAQFHDVIQQMLMQHINK